jgi:cellulose synthase/poly-beta-1,6-N-acetylglucosamine synthase-like glycosyltransferase
MYRVSAFRAVGGFDESVVAGEEPELCMRLRKKGWKIRRVDAEMATHDADLRSFRQWWKRMVRGGYGGLDVAARFEKWNGSFSKQVRSAWIWGIGWPLTILAAGGAGFVLLGWKFSFIFALVVSFGMPLQALRLALRMMRRGADIRTAAAYGMLTMLGKWAHLQGQYRLWRDRRFGRNLSLIEHKVTASPATPLNA